MISVLEKTIIAILLLLFVLSAPAGAVPVVAVLPFEAEGDSLRSQFGMDEELIALALTESSAAALSGLSALELVDRENLEEILSEQRLALSGLVAEETAVEAGKLLGASHLLSARLVYNGPLVTMTARITDAETGKIAAAASLTDGAEQTFPLQEALLEELLDQWDLPLSRRERAALAERKAVPLQGLNNFGKALEARNQGDFEAALTYLSRAVELAPDFSLAREVRQEVEQRFKDFLQFRATGLPEELTRAIEAVARRDEGASQAFLKRYWALMQPVTMGVSYYGAWAAMPEGARAGFFESGIKTSWSMLGLTEEPESMEDVVLAVGQRLHTARGLLNLLIEKDIPLEGFNDFMHPLEGALGSFLTAFAAMTGSPDWQFPPMIGPDGEVSLPDSGYPALILKYGDLMLTNFPYSAYAASVTPLMQTALEAEGKR